MAIHQELIEHVFSEEGKTFFKQITATPASWSAEIEQMKKEATCAFCMMTQAILSLKDFYFYIRRNLIDLIYSSYRE